MAELMNQMKKNEVYHRTTHTRMNLKMRIYHHSEYEEADKVKYPAIILQFASVNLI